MPKGAKSKRKRDRNPFPDVSPDEDSESVCSSLDGSVLSEDGEGVPAGGSENGDAEEDLQFQLAEHLDQLSDKSSHTRLGALAFVNKTLCRKLVSQHLVGSKETILDTITRGLKKVRGSERCSMLQLCALLSVQLGTGNPELFTSLKPLLFQLALDESLSPQERAACVTTIGVSAFVQVSDDPLEVESVMHECERLLPCKKEAVVAAAVQSWALLLSVLPSHTFPVLLHNLLPVLNGLLEGLDTSVRISAGQAIALLFELTRELDEDLLDSQDARTSYDLIQQLATESNRYTARKDRNQLRACFRDILQTLEDGSVPERDVGIGVQVLSLNSWARLIQYSMFKELLGSGMKAHIEGNDLLREVFQLGPPPLAIVESKASRMERKYYNAVVAKHRTQSRSKQRDKRAVL